jgi:hypothetical protein
VRVVALVTDMMDRSRITAALPDTVFVRTAAACAGADVVIVDLARAAVEVAPVRANAPTARIVGYGPHVDDARFATALRDGADRTVARSRFFRDIEAAIT